MKNFFSWVSHILSFHHVYWCKYIFTNDLLLLLLFCFYYFYRYFVGWVFPRQHLRNDGSKRELEDHHQFVCVNFKLIMKQYSRTREDIFFFILCVALNKWCMHCICMHACRSYFWSNGNAQNSISNGLKVKWKICKFIRKIFWVLNSWVCSNIAILIKFSYDNESNCTHCHISKEWI